MRVPPPRNPSSPPLHLRAVDFDAYLPERASSNAFTRPRLELKQRMLTWSRAVVLRLAQMGVPVEVTGSDEHPSVRNGRRVDCQRVFFWRDGAARIELERLLDRKRSLASKLGDPAPHKNHAYLALKLDSQRVEVSVEVHAEAWVDLRNLRARLADPGRALELTTVLESLPDQFLLGAEGDAWRARAQRVTADELRSLVDAVEEKKTALWIGWSLPRDVAVAHSELLDEQLEDAIVALGPVFKLVAWASDNDLVVLDREWDAARHERARAHDEAERDRAEWEARRDGERRDRGRGEAGRPRAEDDAKWKHGDRTRRRDRDREDSRAKSTTKPASSKSAAKDRSSSTPTPTGVAAPAGTPASSSASASTRAQSRANREPMTFGRRPALRRSPTVARARVTEVDPNVPVEKGTRVQVMAGPFEGKVGVVQELDGKGAARVLLGLLAMRFQVKDLIASAEGKDRPVLATSHRKPLPSAR